MDNVHDTEGCLMKPESVHAMPTTKPAFVRPWETSQPNPQSPTTDLTIQESHIALLKEFQLAPRPSISSILWIDTLLHSYIFQINSMDAQDTDPWKMVGNKLLLINQTRHMLQTYKKMSTSATGSSLYGPGSMAMMAPLCAQTASTGSFSSSVTSKPATPVRVAASASPSLSSPVVRPPSLDSPSTPQTRIPTTQIASPDAGYVSQSSNNTSDSEEEEVPSPLQDRMTSTQYSSQCFIPASAQSGFEPSRLSSIPSSTSQISPIHYSFPHVTPPSSRTTVLPPSELSISASTSQQLSKPVTTKFLQPCSRLILEDWYQENLFSPYASDAIADDLAAHAGVSRAKVLKWLSNRRNRDGNTKRTVGRRKKTEFNRAKPYTPRGLSHARLSF